MSRFEVDSTRVSEASAAVLSSAGALSTEVDRMMRNLVDLQSSWKGQASSGFQGVVTEWRGTQERVRAALEDIQRALAAAGRQYADVEAANVRMFVR